MSDEKMREEFEARYPMPFSCGWNSMRNQYECIWFEHAGEVEVEAAIDQHNDRLSVWEASQSVIQKKYEAAIDRKNSITLLQMQRDRLLDALLDLEMGSGDSPGAKKKYKKAREAMAFAAKGVSP